MAFTITSSASALLLTGATPLVMTSAGVYYFKRCIVQGRRRKITIGSSPSAVGSFVQDFDDHSYPITGGSIMLIGADEASIKTAFASYEALISQQVGLSLSIPNENSGSAFANCVNTMFELWRRPDGRIVTPNGDGSLFRAYISMEFIQLSK